MQYWALESLVFLIGIVGPLLALFLLSSQLFSLIAGAPYVPLSRKLIKKVLVFGGLSSGDILYDLGCGDGRVLISGVKDFDVPETIGYEIAPWPYFKALFSIRRHGLIKNIKIFRSSCYKADLSKATFIYLYLFPSLVDKMAYKIVTEVRSPTKILCVDFPVNIVKHPEFQLLKSEILDNTNLYLYEVKIKAP